MAIEDVIAGTVSVEDEVRRRYFEKVRAMPDAEDRAACEEYGRLLFGNPEAKQPEGVIEP